MPTAQAIINKSMRLLGVIASGESPTSAELDDGLESLNSIIDSWSIAAPLGYAEQEITLSLAAGQVAYSLGTAELPVTSITRSGTVATATTAQAHGLVTGTKVTVSGAAQTDYNITATVTVTGATTFTYSVANSPATPATGTLIVRAEGSAVSRPCKLTGAYMREAGVDTPLAVVTEGFWTNVAEKLEQAATLERVMYRLSNPFGLLFVHPLPASSATVIVKVQQSIEGYASLSTTQLLPPGYRRLLELSLALEIAPEFGARVADEVRANLQFNLDSLVQANTARLAGSKLTQPQAAPPARG